MPTTTSVPKKTKLLVQTRLVPRSCMRFDIERCEHDVYYGVIRTIRDLGAEVTQHHIAGHTKITVARNNEASRTGWTCRSLSCDEKEFGIVQKGRAYRDRCRHQHGLCFVRYVRHPLLHSRSGKVIAGACVQRTHWLLAL